MSENKDHYVYVHRLVKTNRVFCVGSGRNKRMYSRHGRSKQWNDLVKENDWYYSILKNNLTKPESEQLEVELIEIYNPIGNVHRTTLEAKALEIDFIKSRYYYDETSPSGLRYKAGNNQKGKKRRVVGDIAGTFAGGRYTVTVQGRNRLAHRVVWLLINNEDPIGYVIDHKDGNPSNNIISNLRKVTLQLNNKNTCLRKDNKSGFKGISNIRGMFYSALLHLNNGRIRKHFSILKFGEELAFALAIEYRNRMISNSDYSERHIGEYVKPSILEKYTEDQIIEMFENNSTFNKKKLKVKSNVRISNTSGINGISFVVKDGIQTQGVAQKITNGKNHCKRMSILKHGKEKVIADLKEWLSQFNKKE